MAPNPHLSRFAAQEFRSRSAAAQHAVRAGRITAAEATGHLRPWLAIACLCGADLPELEDGLAALRTRTIVWPWDKAGQSRDLTETEVRTSLAADICPRARWEPVLKAARDKACNPFADPTQPRGADEADRAISLVTIANHLGLQGWRAPTMIEGVAA